MTKGRWQKESKGFLHQKEGPKMRQVFAPPNPKLLLMTNKGSEEGERVRE